MQNSDFWSRITSLYRSQASPVVSCMQNSVICTGNTSLYGFQPLSVFFSPSKTATLGPDLQVCMGPRPHLWFWAHITRCLAQEYKVYMGSSPHVWFCAFKTASLWPKLHVSIGPSPHVWFLDAKQRLLDWNYKALWVKDHTCCFCMQNFDFWTRITTLYGSQTSPVVLCMQNSLISITITSHYGSHPSSVVSTFKTAHYGPDLLVSMSPRSFLSVCACKTAI